MPRSERRVRVERGLYPAGCTYFACATPRGGRQAVWKTLGEVALIEARRLRDEYVVEARRITRPTRAVRATFADVADEWLRDQEDRVRVGDLQPRTLETYELGLRRHALPELDARQLRAITPTTSSRGIAAARRRPTPWARSAPGCRRWGWCSATQCVAA